MSMTPEEVVRGECDAWSRRDAEEIASYFAPDAVLVDRPTQRYEGLDKIRRVIEGHLRRTKWCEIEIVNLLAADHLVMTERIDKFDYDGARYDTPIMGIFEVRDGKIAAWRDYYELPVQQD